MISKDEQIQIPAGYKMTSLGVIPLEWGVKRLSEIADISSGGTPLREKTEYWNGGDIPWITTSLINQPIINYAEEYITELGLKSSAAKILKKGTLLMAMYGQGITRGKIAKLNISASTNQACAGLQIENSDTDYVYYALYYRYEEIRGLSNDGGQKNLSLGLIKRIKIPLPPLLEQQKIAEILGVWDRGIELQGRAVERLELRKRALMQRLLTARTRLKGFSGEWETTKLGRVSSIKKGVQVNKVTLYKTGDYPVINGGIEPSGYSDSYNAEANTITISEGGNSCGYINLITSKFWCGGHCYSVLENSIINKFFLFHLLKFNELEIMNLRVGSGLPNIQMRAISNFELQIPLFTEQTAITEILTDADREIALARGKLTALRHQKKALMQQLLTGKTRVKI